MPLGIETLADTPGTGAAVERGRRYRVRLRLWLNKGQPIALVQPGAEAPHQVIDADGALNTTIEMHRGRTIPGFFYGMDGMRVAASVSSAFRQTLRMAIVAFLASCPRTPY